MLSPYSLGALLRLLSSLWPPEHLQLLADQTRYLLAENFEVVIYQRLSNAGEVWNYTDPEDEFATPVYGDLKTNVPRTLMEFSDFPWPARASLFLVHQLVKICLQFYSIVFAVPIRFKAQVVDVHHCLYRHEQKWQVTTQNVGKEQTSKVQ